MTTVCKNITVAITEQLLLDPPHCWLLIENAQEPVEVTRWGPIRQHCKNRDCELASGQETKLSDAIHCCKQVLRGRDRGSDDDDEDDEP